MMICIISTIKLTRVNPLTNAMSSVRDTQSTKKFGATHVCIYYRLENGGIYYAIRYINRPTTYSYASKSRVADRYICMVCNCSQLQGKWISVVCGVVIDNYFLWVIC